MHSPYSMYRELGVLSSLLWVEAETGPLPPPGSPWDSGKGRRHQRDISIPKVPSPQHRVKWKGFNITQTGTNGWEARRNTLLLRAMAERRPRREQSSRGIPGKRRERGKKERNS